MNKQGKPGCHLAGGEAVSPGVALPGQFLGFITQQHADIDRQHVCYARRQQLVQGEEDDQVITQLEQVATVTLANAAHLFANKQHTSTSQAGLPVWAALCCCHQGIAQTH